MILTKQSNGGIKKKILRALVLVLIITLIFSVAATLISVLVVRSRNETQLINQAVSSAEIYTKGQAQTINEQLSGVASMIQQSAGFLEYAYVHPEEFQMNSIKTPDEFGDDTTGNQIHWLPFDKEDLNNPSVVAEANLLASLDPEFKSVMDTCSMVVSLYVATNTRVNIGYDQAVLSKRGIGAYNPQEAGAKWFTETLKTGKMFISDTYLDTFERGLMVTIAVPYRVENEIRGVIGADIVIENINKQVLDIKKDGMSNYAMLFSDKGDPICAKDMSEKTTAVDLLGSQNAVDKLKKNSFGTFQGHINGEDSYILFDTIDLTGWKIAIVLSVDSIVAPAREANNLIVMIVLILILVNVALFFAMLIAVGKLANGLSAPLITLATDVEKIGDGNLDYQSNIQTGDEIQILSENFEQMTVSLKEHIKNLTTVTAEKERIGAELDVAAHIQSSMLPCIFPPFPERKEVDIYATMNPAKEVGGDFYDFFMVDERHVAIVMADVSGKGVPAALFMVIGKTLIKDHTTPGANLSNVFATVNNMLCEANSEGLFITAFEGVLDLVTGEFTFVNAGHEMPFICKAGDTFKPYKIKAGFVLAGMENMRFTSGSMMLEPGDKVFQYTDGVTEATNAQSELFGMERLEATLAKAKDGTPYEVLPTVKKDVDDFVGEAPQFDDITMLCLEYKERMTETPKATEEA